MRNHVDGWDEVEADVRQTERAVLLHQCGLSDGAVQQAAEAIGRARRGVVLWAMGLTHHAHGVENILALTNVALARGWVGREGCGLLPIRGHSNVQGVGSVGFTPALKRTFAAAMAEAYGVAAASQPGLDTYGSMAAAQEGKIQVAVLLGGNLFGSNPNRAWAAAALQRVGTTCCLSTTLNEGHVHGRGRQHVILPVRARDEEWQPTTQESMFNYVRLSDGGHAAPANDIKSEVEVVCALAARVLPPGPFPFAEMTDHEAVRRAIARVVPGYDAIAAIGRSRQEFQIAGRTFHEPRFPTPTGRAQARVPALPAFSVAEGEFRLMTLRSEGQFNTVVYEEEDLYRGTLHREIVMMNEADARRLGLSEGARVTVVTEAGRMQVSAALIDIPPGNLAMYFPEANALVPRRVDPASGTPAFKSVAARLEIS